MSAENNTTEVRNIKAPLKAITVIELMYKLESGKQTYCIFFSFIKFTINRIRLIIQTIIIIKPAGINIESSFQLFVPAESSHNGETKMMEKNSQHMLQMIYVIDLNACLIYSVSFYYLYHFIGLASTKKL